MTVKGIVRRGALPLIAFLVLGCVSTAARGPVTAIRNVTLIDPDAGSTPHATIILRGDRIERVGLASEVAIPQGARVVEGDSLYAIPGLWDMHVHAHRDQRERYHYPLYVAHGVTTVRDAGTHLGSALAAMNEKPVVSPAPSVIWGSPPIDGAPPVLSFGLAAENELAARRLVREIKRAGFDFVKVYDRLKPDVYDAVLDEARLLNIPVDGHVPLASTPAHATMRGQRTIEHLTLVLESCIPGSFEWIHKEPDADSMALLEDGRLARTLDAFDPALCEELFRGFREAGTWHIPTLVQMDGAWFTEASLSDLDAAIRLVPAEVQDEWREYRETAEPDKLRAGRAVFQRQLKLVGDMHRAGVRILAGTDSSTEVHVVPGWSLHDEMALLVEAGLTPIAALRAATTEPARHSRPAEPVGLRAGARADLVLLRADPTRDIANSRSIEVVVLRGEWFDRAAIDRMLGGR